MAGLTVARVWQTVKPHIPLIKFRKGGLSADGKVQDARLSGAGGHAPAVAPRPAGASPQPKVVAAPVIEDYQLPARYRRQALYENEIEYINRGGPE